MNFSQILASLGPLLEPIILQEWESQVLPALQAYAAKIVQPDEKIAVQALVVFLDTVAKAEIAKI